MIGAGRSSPGKPRPAPRRETLPLWLGLGFGVFFWLLDAGIDAFIHHNGDFFGELFSSHALRSWERPLVFAILVGFSWAVYALRKRAGGAEATLLGSLEFTSKVVDSISDPLFVKDADHRRVLVNDAYCVLLGRTRAELLGRSDQDLYSPEQAALFCAQDDVILTGSGEQLTEETTINLQGNQLVLSVKKSLFVDRSGKRFVVGLARDITDRRRAEEEIKTKAQLLDTATDAILLLDPQGNFLYFNDALPRMTGYSREELQRRGLHNIEPPEFAARIADNIARLFASGAAIFESAYLKQDGSVLPVEVHARVSQVGTRPAVLSLVRDISERKKMEEFLLQAKTEWEETFNIITEAITVHDLEFNIVRWNKAAAALLGLPLDTPGRQKCYASFHGVSTPPGDCVGCRVLKTGCVSTVEVYEPHLKKHLEIRVLPRRDVAGKLIGVVHVVRDITARKIAEEQQQHLQVQFLQAQKMDSIGRLAGGIAHDFNNILSSVLGFSELGLLKTDREMPQRQMFQVIHNAGLKAAALIRQLLAFSRRQVLEVRPVDLHAVIEEFGAMLRRVIREDVLLELELAAVRHTVLADPNQIEQVLMNLAVNARDAMPGGGRLIIGTSDLDSEAHSDPVHVDLMPGPHVVITVRDTGSGMSPEVRERIFEPFYTTKEVGKGTGLGLATVYGIVKQHLGTITVESEPGRGTTFTITLPVSDEEIPATKDKVASELPSGTETVLLVDDEPEIRDLVSTVLGSLGYRVFVAVDAADALRVAAAIPGSIDVLLTDVIMPGMNGRELADALLRVRPSLAVVFISGYTDDIIAPHGILPDGTNFLPKPVTPTSVATALRRVLDGD